MGAQTVVGVGGHRHGRPFEQREIVHRIGIEGHPYLFRSQIAARKPETEIVHLSLSEIGFPVDLASNVAARVSLQLGGDDVVIGKPKGLADRARTDGMRQVAALGRWVRTQAARPQDQADRPIR